MNNYSRRINLGGFVILLNLALLIVAIIGCNKDELKDLKVADVNSLDISESASLLALLHPGFITSWSAQTITIPTNPNFTYNYSVDWNDDGVFDQTGITGDVTHTFETDGEHTIRITGKFPAIRFGKLPKEEAEKIISVDQWGDGEWRSMYDAFANCSNLKLPARDIPNLFKVENISRMFRNGGSANPDVSEWNTENVKYMTAMFQGASSANPDVSNWNISNIRRMPHMFDSSGLSPENYGKVLIRFAAHENDPNLSLSQHVELGDVPTAFCGQEAQDAKTLLIGKGWSIKDRGFISSCSELSDAFVTTWSAQTITIPTKPGITYNYSVDWDNDGLLDQTGITGDVTHTFETDGKHTIRITGTFPDIWFRKLSREEAKKIISIDQWGTNEWHSMSGAFEECSNLEVPATDIPDLSKVISMLAMFKHARQANPDVSHWNTSNVIIMSDMFRGNEVANPDVSNWNTSNLTTCFGMFQNAKQANPDVSNWDISKWGSGNFFGPRSMFANSGLTQENYEKALIRFAAHESDPTLTLPPDLDLGAIPATLCSPEAQAAQTLLLGKGWVIKGQGCPELLEASFVTTWSAQTITLPTDPNLTYNYSVDWDNDGLLDQTGITGDVTHTFETDGEHTIRITGTLPAIQFGKLPVVQAAKIISVDQWGKIEWLSMRQGFKNCSNLEVPATDIPDLSKVKNMGAMFRGATLANPDVSNWNTQNVGNFSFMFHGATSANPDVSGWNTENARDMNGMFEAATSANPDVSEWNTQNLRSINVMFRDAISANADMSQWNFSNIDLLGSMFDNSGLSQENYEKFLIRLAVHASDPNLTLPENLALGDIPTTLCSPEAQVAKALLLSKGWIINDQGADTQCQSTPPVVAELRQKLSELNLFQGEDLSDLTPSPLVFEYELNSKLFTDHAKKQRLIALPSGEQMISNGDELPDFPDNTVISKTFYYNFDDRNPFLGREIIETRILIRQNGQWVTGNYLWNDGQTEAFLTEDDSNTDISFINSDGNNVNIAYAVPSKADCFTCHQTNSNTTPIGPKLRNMNLVANGSNQLQSLIDRQWLTGIFHPNEISVLPDSKDPNETLDNRTRAYLEVNCAHCHIDGGLAQFLDIRFGFDTPLAETGIKANGDLIENFMANGLMPLIGATIVDKEGLELIKEFIDNLE